MLRQLAIATLLWTCAFAVAAQIEDTAPPPDDGDLIQRVNAEIDRRTVEGDTPRAGSFSSGEPASLGQQFLRGIFALCTVVALIFLAYYGVRRWGKRVPMLAGVSLGNVLGRIHLERGTTLHFVRTTGRVLLVGVNGNAISLIADFEQSEFDELHADSQDVAPPAKEDAFNPDSFLAQLQARSPIQPSTPAEDTVDDDEISALRGDIQRLQKYLREESRESQD